MTVSKVLLCELERRLKDLNEVIEELKNDSWGDQGNCYHKTRACGRLKRRLLDVHEIGVKIRKGDMR